MRVAAGIKYVVLVCPLEHLECRLCEFFLRYLGSYTSLCGGGRVRMEDEENMVLERRGAAESAVPLAPLTGPSQTKRIVLTS